MLLGLKSLKEKGCKGRFTFQKSVGKGRTHGSRQLPNPKEELLKTGGEELSLEVINRTLPIC